MRRREIVLIGIIKILFLLGVCTAIGLAFILENIAVSNVIVIYILGVIAVAMWTEGRKFSLVYSILAVVMFNFFFVEPRYSLLFEPSYITTFIVIFLVALLISTITTRLKEKTYQNRLIEEKARHEAMRANFLRSISHDLRTPLTGISGNAGLLINKSNKLSEEKKQDIYKAIQDDSNWLISLVENILAITRVGDVERGDINLNMNVELISDIVDEAVQHCDKRIARHKLCIEHEDEFLMARVDVRLILLVFINLINNAVKYTPAGSEIAIRTGKKDGWAVIRVEDNGPGISDKDKKSIFERFYIAECTESDGKRGMGLGLSLCRSAVEAHKGHIEVKDNEPRGTIFEFTLPLVEARYE